MGNSRKRIKKALEHENMEYVINEGDGAFYGPKIDFHIKIVWEEIGNVEQYNWISKCQKDLI